MKATVILCSGGYVGLIFGFFGGILYLYKVESRHHSAPSALSDVSVSADPHLALKTKTAA